MRGIRVPLHDVNIFLVPLRYLGGNLLSSPDNGRMIKEEINHAGMYLYEHNSGAGRETKNYGREHLRAL